MGRDKSRLRVGARSLLGHARHLASELGLPVRVIRRDLVPRCGPLGGILTALCTTKAGADLFLACDMPFVTPTLLKRLLDRLRRGSRAVFVEVDGVVGFPFVLEAGCLPVVERQMALGKFSLQALAGKLGADRVSPVRSHNREAFNVNTNAEFREARRVALEPARRARRADRH